MPTDAVSAVRALLPDSHAVAAQLVETSTNLAFDIRDNVNPADAAERLATGKNPPSTKQTLEDRLKYALTRAKYLARLSVVLAAMIDIDSTPADLLAWADAQGPAVATETIRRRGAMRQAALDVEHDLRMQIPAVSVNTLPPVSLASMHDLATAADLLGLPHPCGTIGAYGRHLRAKEAPCPRCTLARNVYDNATPAERTRPGARQQARHLKPCGTAAAYKRHISHGQTPCELCVAANTEHNRKDHELRLARQGKVPSRRRAESSSRGTSAAAGTRRAPKLDSKKLKPCGTPAAYNRHRRAHEEACQPCVDAHTLYCAQRAAARMKAADEAAQAAPAITDRKPAAPGELRTITPARPAAQAAA